MSTGKPRKDPTTGYMMSHSLHTTDVTQSADPKRYNNNNEYTVNTSANLENQTDAT
jgi:hypothetical protein